MFHQPWQESHSGQLKWISAVKERLMLILAFAVPAAVHALVKHDTVCMGERMKEDMVVCHTPGWYIQQPIAAVLIKINMHFATKRKRL